LPLSSCLSPLAPCLSPFASCLSPLLFITFKTYIIMESEASNVVDAAMLLMLRARPALPCMLCLCFAFGSLL
jgi:hypothetical protein